MPATSARPATLRPSAKRESIDILSAVEKRKAVKTKKIGNSDLATIIIQTTLLESKLI